MTSEFLGARNHMNCVDHNYCIQSLLKSAMLKNYLINKLKFKNVESVKMYAISIILNEFKIVKAISLFLRVILLLILIFYQIYGCQAMVLIFGLKCPVCNYK